MQPSVSPELENAIAAARSGRWLHLVILPTEACNLRCTYCYEEFRLGRMRPDVEQGITRLLDRRIAGLDDLALSWFGGEPLLALDIVERILLHVQQLRRRHPDVRFLSDVTTNGTRLDRATFERLVALGVRRYQVSFDGPEASHDRTRAGPKGQATFTRIWRNLIDMRSSASRIAARIRIHVHDANSDSLPPFVEQLAAEFGGDSRFHVFFKPVAALGGSGDAQFPFLRGPRAAHVVAALVAQARSLGLQCQDSGGAVSMCYAARANSIVVRADGRLNKCTVALEHPANQVGQLDADGVIHLNEIALAAWTRGLRSGDPLALHCPMRGLADPPGAASPPPHPTVAVPA